MQNNKILFFVLLVLWVTVNMVQSFLTEVISDEAYYFLYGKFLDWGYYDHPPMVGFLVRLSSLFFKGNLGIRFFTVILQAGTLLLIWSSVTVIKNARSQILYFFLIAASIVMFSAYGFITTPDSPLLFFTALFVYAYKRFLEKENLGYTFLMSLAMAGLVYSKYHGVLIIGLVVLSNLRILRSWKFWFAGICAVIMLAPHLAWQIGNDFVSFRFQLSGRSEGFRMIYFLEYLPNQMAALNPFIFGAIIYVLIKYKPADLFIRSLYFIIAGFMGFFWLSSFRGHVEPHWTIACSIPIIILLISKLQEDIKLLKFLRYTLLPSLVLILLVRIVLITDLPLIKSISFSGKNEKYRFVESVSQGLPVLFQSSYQAPALYTYFTDKEAFPVSTLYNRKTQFDIWQLDRQHHNKKVFVVCSDCPGIRLFENDRFTYYGFVVDSLQTTNRLSVLFKISGEIVSPGDTLKIPFSVSNPDLFNVDFNHPIFPVKVCAAYIKDETVNIQQVRLSSPLDGIPGGGTIHSSLETVVPDLKPGWYKLGITLQTMLGPTLNSAFVKVKVEGNE